MGGRDLISVTVKASMALAFARVTATTYTFSSLVYMKEHMPRFTTGLPPRSLPLMISVLKAVAMLRLRAGNGVARQRRFRGDGPGREDWGARGFASGGGRRDASWVRVTHSTSSRYWRSRMTSPRRLRKYRALSATGGLRAMPCNRPPPLAIFAGPPTSPDACSRPALPVRERSGVLVPRIEARRRPDEPEAGSRVGRAVVPGYYPWRVQV